MCTMIVSLILMLGAHVESVATCAPEAGRSLARIEGKVIAGQTFEATLGEFIFRLTPTPEGWLIGVFEKNGSEDLSRLTPPWHGLPNPREVEGWQFRNADNTGPNEGSVNAPGEIRDFIFSPEVGKTIEYRGSATSAEDVTRVSAFGRGRLEIIDYGLSEPLAGERARFLWIRFSVCLSWPTPRLG